MDDTNRELARAPLDTTREASRRYFDALRRLTPSQRADRVAELNANARSLCESGVRARHPEYTEDQVRLAIVRILLGRKLFARVHPGIEIEP